MGTQETVVLRAQVRRKNKRSVAIIDSRREPYYVDLLADKGIIPSATMSNHLSLLGQLFLLSVFSWPLMNLRIFPTLRPCNNIHRYIAHCLHLFVVPPGFASFPCRPIVRRFLGLFTWPRHFCWPGGGGVGLVPSLFMTLCSQLSAVLLFFVFHLHSSCVLESHYCTYCRLRFE